MCTMPGNAHIGTNTISGCDIQKHLQSMFYLLREKETLKMVSETQAVHMLFYLIFVVVISLNRGGRLSNWKRLEMVGHAT